MKDKFKISAVNPWKFKVDELKHATLYDDWFLPSLYEAQLQYLNLHLFGLGNFQTALQYHTSSEHTNPAQIRVMNFSTGAFGTVYKAYTSWFRPIRKFAGVVGAYSLRDIGPAGGLIFYVDNTTYYESSLSDLGTIQWSNVTDSGCGATDLSIGAGLANTNLIINQVGHITSAAKLCSDYSVGDDPLSSDALGKVKFLIRAVSRWIFKVTEIATVDFHPTVQAAVIDDNTVELHLTFDVDLNDLIVPDFIDFVYSEDVINIAVAGNKVILTLQNSIQYGDTTQVSYIPGSNILQDEEGNLVEAFTMDVDTSALIAPPEPVSAEVGPTLPGQFKITFDSNLNENLLPDTSFFTIPGVTVTGLSVDSLDASKLLLDVTPDASYGSVYTITYERDPDTPLQGTTNNYVIDFEIAVTNNVTQGYEDETLTLIAAGRYDTEPSTALKDLIDTVIAGLKTDGVFSKADCIYFRGVHESKFACQNWRKDAHNSTLVNAPTFTAKEGFKGNGTSSYINNNYTPYTEAVQMTRDSGTIVIMHKELGSVSGRSPFGAQNNSVTKRLYYIMYEPGNDRMYFNSNSFNDNLNFQVNKYTGYVRNGNVGLNVQGYIDGVASGAGDDLSGSSMTLPDYSIFELANNVNGSANSFYNGETSFMWIGSALNATEMLAVYTWAKYFYDNVGSTF